MQTLHAIRGAQQSSKRSWEGKDGKAFRDVGCKPFRQTRSALLVFRNGFGKVGVCSSSVGSIEDHPKVCRHFGLHLLAWHIGLRILLEMELASLPRDATKDCYSSCPQSCMVVTGEEVHTSETALLQAFKKGSLVDFMFAQGH